VTSKASSLAAINLPSAVSGNAFNADNEMTDFGSTSLSYDTNGNLTCDGANTHMGREKPSDCPAMPLALQAI
jgi:hypothetical protein